MVILRQALAAGRLLLSVHKSGLWNTHVFIHRQEPPGLGHTRVRGVVGLGPKQCTDTRGRE